MDEQELERALGRAGGPQELPPDVDHRVRARLETEMARMTDQPPRTALPINDLAGAEPAPLSESAPRSERPWLRPVLAAAGLLLVLGAALLFARSGDSDDTVTTQAPTPGVMATPTPGLPEACRDFPAAAFGERSRTDLLFVGAYEALPSTERDAAYLRLADALEGLLAVARDSEAVTPAMLTSLERAEAEARTLVNASTTPVDDPEGIVAAIDLALVVADAGFADIGLPDCLG